MLNADLIGTRPWGRDARACGLCNAPCLIFPCLCSPRRQTQPARPSQLAAFPALPAPPPQGFHTFDYARHFLSCCSRMLGLEHKTTRGSISVEYYGRNVGLKIMPTGEGGFGVAGWGRGGMRGARRRASSGGGWRKHRPGSIPHPHRPTAPPPHRQASTPSGCWRALAGRSTPGAAASCLLSSRAARCSSASTTWTCSRASSSSCRWGPLLPLAAGASAQDPAAWPRAFAGPRPLQHDSSRPYPDPALTPLFALPNHLPPKAYERVLEEHPEFVGHTVLVQVRGRAGRRGRAPDCLCTTACARLLAAALRAPRRLPHRVPLPPCLLAPLDHQRAPQQRPGAGGAARVRARPRGAH
jgi:hypothetical protein